MARGHYFSSEALLRTGIGKGAVKGNGFQEPDPGILPPLGNAQIRSLLRIL